MRSLQLSLILPCIFLLFSQQWRLSSGLGVRQEEADFCYDEPQCGPGSWTGVCQSGNRQSPIDIPTDIEGHFGFLIVDARAYRASRFNLTNEGVSVKAKFLESDRDNDILKFPSSTLITRGLLSYKFDGAHFHWGSHPEEGSEHCIDGICSSMELHLVHYRAEYESVDDAIADGKPDALAVFAVLLEATSESSPVLAPIVRNIPGINTAGQTITINENLDFGQWLQNQHSVFNYAGSLTTPSPLECNEQVNWFVMQDPLPISPQDVEAFRSVKQKNGNNLSSNFRPRQNRNERDISRFFVTYIDRLL